MHAVKKNKRKETIEPLIFTATQRPPIAIQLFWYHYIYTLYLDIDLYIHISTYWYIYIFIYWYVYMCVLLHTSTYLFLLFRSFHIIFRRTANYFDTGIDYMLTRLASSLLSLSRGLQWGRSCIRYL